MNVMALDVGHKRIGVAVSDTTGLLASPLTAIESQDDSERLEAVLTLATEHDVGETVVTSRHARASSSSISGSTSATRLGAASLQRHAICPTLTRRSG